jgi:hypothetical protein
MALFYGGWIGSDHMGSKPIQPGGTPGLPANFALMGKAICPNPLRPQRKKTLRPENPKPLPRWEKSLRPAWFRRFG